MTPKGRTPSRRRGFTLIELLVVVAIIALLVSILLPSLGRAKELARRAICGSNNHNMGSSWAIYFTANNQRIPQLQRANQESVGPFYYCLWFYDNYYNAGLLTASKIVSNADIYACPSFVASEHLSSHWRTATATSNGNYRPEAAQSDFVSSGGSIHRPSRMTYNTRRCKYYYDPGNKYVYDGLDNNSAQKDLLLRNNSLETVGKSQFITNGSQSASTMSFMMDMNDCPSEMLMSHPPGANVLFFDNHVVYFQDTTPGGKILYDNGVDEDWNNQDLSYWYDQIFMNIDQWAGSGLKCDRYP